MIKMTIDWLNKIKMMIKTGHWWPYIGYQGVGAPDITADKPHPPHFDSDVTVNFLA